MNENLPIGSRIAHERYGDGTIIENNLTNYEVSFDLGGRRNILKSTDEATVISEAPETDEVSNNRLTLSEVEEVITYILEKYNGISEYVPLGDKWSDGTMILKPGTSGLQSKEIPIETFFHKIVMLRDRLRVLEQQINSHPKLNDEDRINLQQYITRSYGSLTTFNVLFKDKDDYFVGSGGKE